MIIDEIKKQNILAIKNKDSNLRGIYSIILNKIMLADIEARTTGKSVDDSEVVRIIQKTIKELEEEANNYLKVNHQSDYERIISQKVALEIYLPKMLTANEIKNEILSLDDKSVPAVMRHFKGKYGSSVDMKLVGDTLRSL